MSLRALGEPVGLVRLSERILVTVVLLLAVGGAIGVGLGHLLAAGVQLLLDQLIGASGGSG